MNHDITLDLISRIIALINSEDFVATIPALSEICGVPVEYIRKFILRLINNTIFSTCINAEDSTSGLGNSIMDDYLNDKEGFKRNLLLGKYDNYQWNADLKILNSEDSQIIGLNALEYGMIQNLDDYDINFRHSTVYEYKDSSLKITKAIRSNQEKIQTAIDNRYTISFDYKDNKGIIANHTGFPTEIITNVVDNWIYFSLANEYTYRLDRVISSIKIIKSPNQFQKILPNPKKKYVWGAFYNESDVPIHVKIVITDINKNLIQKIRNDTLYRDKAGICRLYKKHGYYYYEDDIIGINEFQRWLRGFGSSIQVIEPESLRKDMINSAKKALDYYSRSENWKDL